MDHGSSMRSMYRSHVGEIFSLGERILEIDARVVLEEEKELSSSARDRLASNRRHLDRLAIFSPFRGSNRVVDCSVAREKGNKDRDRDQLVLAASREIPTSGNRPSRLATGTEIERSGMGGGRVPPPRRLSPRSRVSLSLSLSLLPALFAAHPSTRSFFAHEGQEEAGRERSRRNEDEKGRTRTKPNERGGRARAARRRDSWESKTVEERKCVGKRKNKGMKRERGQQFRRRSRRGSQHLKKIGGG